MFFVWDYIANVTGDWHLHWALHHLINVPLDILIQAFTLLFDILTIQIFTPYFGCNPYLPTQQLITCMSERPPNFFQAFNQTCMFATNATVWIDDTIEQVLIEFTQDPTEDIIPDVFTPIGPAICAGTKNSFHEFLSSRFFSEKQVFTWPRTSST